MARSLEQKLAWDSVKSQLNEPVNRLDSQYVDSVCIVVNRLRSTRGEVCRFVWRFKIQLDQSLDESIDPAES